MQVARVLGLPCIVKPNRGCGGRGVYRVDQAADLRHFIGLAFKHDTQVLVEPFIEDGIEVRQEVRIRRNSGYLVRRLHI